MRGVLAAAGLLATFSVAMAQQAPDPRLAGPTVKALQALVELREAEIRAQAEDLGKRLAQREHDWAEAFKTWCGERPACGLPLVDEKSPSKSPDQKP